MNRPGEEAAPGARYAAFVLLGLALVFLGLGFVRVLHPHGEGVPALALALLAADVVIASALLSGWYPVRPVAQGLAIFGALVHLLVLLRSGPILLRGCSGLLAATHGYALVMLFQLSTDEYAEEHDDDHRDDEPKDAHPAPSTPATEPAPEPVTHPENVPHSETEVDANPEPRPIPSDAGAEPEPDKASQVPPNQLEVPAQPHDAGDQTQHDVVGVAGQPATDQADSGTERQPASDSDNHDSDNHDSDNRDADRPLV